MRALGRWIGVEVAPWLIAGAVLVFVLSLSLPIAASLALGIGITVVIALMSWTRRGRTRLARYRDMEGVDDMTGEEFEDWLAVLFRRAGWRVRHTGASGDFGADLIISRDGEEWVVQAKRQARPVGVAAVQQAAAARPHYDADGAMVVTNATFTAQARSLAASADVVLWDHDDIAAELITGRAAAIGHEVR
jgi:restriction system protein